MRNIIFAWLILLAGCRHPADKLRVGIQPIGQVSKGKVELVKRALGAAYNTNIVVLTPVNPPHDAFVNFKTPRYRADKLIAWLKFNKPDSLDYVMGITELDVSTTKRNTDGAVKEPKSRYEDFGIFGLGYMPGVSSVVSSFRLGSDEALMYERLAKICVHELGHNLSLDHCANKKCVMTDAVERMTTIDNAEKSLCDGCRRKVGWR